MHTISFYNNRPAKSSDKAEDLPSLGIFFENLPLFPFLTGHSKYTTYKHILLFSTRFVISLHFGDVEMEKNGLILCHRQIKYHYIFRA